jgi:FixJ family two-component response regulator
MTARRRTQRSAHTIGSSAVRDRGTDHASERAHILIATDDDRLCESVELALRHLAYTATRVRSGLEVVNRVDARRSCLIVLDQDLPDATGLDVARALGTNGPRFVLAGHGLTTSVTVAAMKLGAITVLEKPVAVTEVVTLLRSVVEGAAAGPHTPARIGNARAPRSVAERWAQKVLQGCEADGDPRTLAEWATVAGLSYSSLCETCRLIGIQPLAARDLTRVLRAVVQSRAHDCRVGELLDICDRRTLNALMARAAVDPWRPGRDISVEQFLVSQRFVPLSNAGLVMLRALLPR